MPLWCFSYSVPHNVFITLAVDRSVYQRSRISVGCSQIIACLLSFIFLCASLGRGTTLGITSFSLCSLALSVELLPVIYDLEPSRCQCCQCCQCWTTWEASERSVQSLHIVHNTFAVHLQSIKAFAVHTRAHIHWLSDKCSNCALNSLELCLGHEFCKRKLQCIC